MKRLIFAAIAAMCGMITGAETIHVKAGETVRVPAGKTFTGDLLIKEGPGVLDLSGAVLRNKGLEIREGSVLFAAGDGQKETVTTKHFRFCGRESRPAKNNAPEHANSGIQLSEMRFFKDGKMLTIPAGSTAFSACPANGSEDGSKSIDNNFATKWYGTYKVPLDICFAQPLAIDGYSFATANDAIGRDPCSWTVFAGEERNGNISWAQIGAENGYKAPKDRRKDIGKIFTVRLVDLIPFEYQIKICANSKLVLKGVNESVENLCGRGLIELQNANISFPPETAFKGSVYGKGFATYQK